MEGTCHEGIIIGSIAEDYKLCTTEGIIVLGKFSGLLHDLTHKADSIHIDTGLGRSDVNAGTDELGISHCHGNGTNQIFVISGHALGYDGGISTDKVHAEFLGATIQGMCNRHIILRALTAGRAYGCNGGDRDSLIHDRNAIFLLDLGTDLNKISCNTSDLLIDFLVALV